jgi:hypothetical protein
MPPDPGNNPGPVPNNPTIESIVRAHYDNPATPPPEVLVQALVDREDRIVEQLHMAGMQFGLYPQIIAEVLATVGLGTPPSVEGRALIRQQFIALMEELQRQQGGGGSTI